MHASDETDSSVKPETIAMVIQANPGVYALLLGAGVSMDSGIPSAWQVMDHLCRKLARCHGKDVEEEQGQIWYKDHFGQSPSYSELFDELTKSGVERVGLLRSYFEATASDLETGNKLPTIAHRAIARLVAHGYIRVILTTNFDRLLEAALSELGVTPVIISTDNDASNKPPFAHNRCTVLKLHGDYLDSTFRNTKEELLTYPPALKKRLLQLLWSSTVSSYPVGQANQTLLFRERL